jgi:hypothetical protein
VARQADRGLPPAAGAGERPEFRDTAGDADGRLLMGGTTPDGDRSFQAQTRDPRYADT